MTWVVIIAVAAGSIAFKVIGPLVAGGYEPPARLTRVLDLMTPALLAALVVVGTLDDDGAIVLDSRVLGLAIGALALACRLPLALALVLAAGGAALTRLLPL